MKLLGMFVEWIMRADDLDGDVDQLGASRHDHRRVRQQMLAKRKTTGTTLRRWFAAMNHEGLNDDSC